MEVLPDAALVRIPRRNAQPRDVPVVEPQEARDRRVRLTSDTLDARAEVEVELLDQRPAERDQRFPAEPAPAVLVREGGLGDRFDDGQQQRHVLRPAARHHAGDGDVPDGCLTPLGQERAEHLVRLTVGEREEPLDASGRGRDDRQAVRPLLTMEQLVDVVDRPAEDDVARLGRDHAFHE
jgi:hypothetical protein